jgi:hypothetical protein
VAQIPHGVAVGYGENPLQGFYVNECDIRRFFFYFCRFSVKLYNTNLIGENYSFIQLNETFLFHHASFLVQLLRYLSRSHVQYKLLWGDKASVDEASLLHLRQHEQ